MNNNTERYKHEYESYILSLIDAADLYLKAEGISFLKDLTIKIAVDCMANGGKCNDKEAKIQRIENIQGFLLDIITTLGFDTNC